MTFFVFFGSKNAKTAFSIPHAPSFHANLTQKDTRVSDKKRLPTKIMMLPGNTHPKKILPLQHGSLLQQEKFRYQDTTRRRLL
jgi:hypothetical protein